MNEIDNTPMSGAQWATHHVAVWLENDYHLAERAKGLANEQELDAWVDGLLYDLDFTGVRVLGGDVNAAKNVRESFTREDFEGIDWSAVRESLLAE